MTTLKRMLLTLAVLIPLGAHAAATNATSETTEASNRMKRRLGAYVGLFGDPYPTIVGINVAYNALDFLRVSGGLGQLSASSSFGGADASATATTIGAGARFFVPGWSFSPVAGLGFAYVNISQSGGMKVSVNNFDSSGAHLYGTIGVDWQAGNGFNVGGGYNLSFKSGVGGQPYVNVGWFFDLI